MEAEMAKMWLQDGGIPCQIRYEQLRKIFGDNAYAGLPHQTELMVPLSMMDNAKARMAEQFDIEPWNVPEYCPACGEKSKPGKLDCPGCGLFLG